jgi:phage shock protein C
MAAKKKHLRKSKNKMIAGVISGLAEYFDIDPTLLRIAWLLVFSITGFIPGLIAYIADICHAQQIMIQKNTSSKEEMNLLYQE